METVGSFALVLTLGAVAFFLKSRRIERRARKAAQGRKLNPWS